LLTISLMAVNAAPSRLDGTNGCTDCHNSAKRELDASNHGHLGYGTGMGMYEKWCSLPNFILAEEGHGAWTTKCGGCHIGGNGLESFDKDYQCQYCHTADPNGAVTVASCATKCHAPKDWRKRGDVFDAASDLHIAAGMVCQSCHVTRKHKIGKGTAIDTTEPSQYAMKVCVDCHGLAPHDTDTMYNDHTGKVSCETCHIGMRPAGAFISRTWNIFNYKGKPISIFEPAEWLPEYKWYNGTGEADHTHMPVLDYCSQMNDAGAKIYPFNAVAVTWFAKIPGVDDAIVVSDVKACDADGNLETTVAEMRACTNTPSGNTYPEATLVTETINFQISHGVNEIGAAFTCNDCHNGGWVLDWEQLCYEGDPGISGTFSVSDIALSVQAAGNKRNASATITVSDTGGSPVSGATVSGSWSGATSDSDTGVTDSGGQVTLTSDTVKTKDSLTFDFCVDGADKTGWTYDPAGNVETCDSITD
jgi:hypothetical protein